MGKRIAESRPTVATLRPFTLVLIRSPELVLLLQHNRKYEVASLVAYLSGLDTAVTPNDKSGRVSGNSTDHFQVKIKCQRKLIRGLLLNCRLMISFE
jgi:hypothetical protein